MKRQEKMSPEAWWRARTWVEFPDSPFNDPPGQGRRDIEATCKGIKEGELFFLASKWITATACYAGTSLWLCSRVKGDVGNSIAFSLEEVISTPPEVLWERAMKTSRHFSPWTHEASCLRDYQFTVASLCKGREE